MKAFDAKAQRRKGNNNVSFVGRCWKVSPVVHRVERLIGNSTGVLFAQRLATGLLGGMDENALSYLIIAAAIEVHRTLGGPGLLESVYEEALTWELLQRGISVERQKTLPVRYKEITLGAPLKVDLVVGEIVVVECKSVVEYNPIFEAQLLTYRRLTGLRLGLVINFGAILLRHGVHRVVNSL